MADQRASRALAMSIQAIQNPELLTSRTHALHNPTRTWVETNCYVDLLIEVLAGVGCDPVVALGFSLGIEFEGDQWSFLKYPIDDLRVAYGIDVSELALWQPLADHLVEQLGFGRLVVVEVDAFHLPDTHGTSYRTAHVKSSIAVTHIDPELRSLRYFHGAGHFTVTGEDYDGLLRLGNSARFTVDVLPPYAEIIKLDRGVVLAEADAKRVARQLANQHLVRRRSAEDSAQRFSERLSTDAQHLLRDMASFHAYAFATVRQLGAASELASNLFTLLEAPVSAERFASAARSCKTLQFKFARVAAGRSLDLASAVDETMDCWLSAMASAQNTLNHAGVAP
jgi:Domain of unknown function (DUF1839)